MPCKTSGVTIHFVHGKTASSDDYDHTTHVPHRERFRCHDRCKTHVAKRKGQEVKMHGQTAWRFHRMLSSEASVTVMVGTVSLPGMVTVSTPQDGVKNRPSQVKQEKYTVVENID